jgi:hypothetical protein
MKKATKKPVQERTEAKDPIEIMKEVIARNEDLFKGSFKDLTVEQQDIVLVIAASQRVLEYAAALEKKLVAIVAAQPDPAAQRQDSRVEVLDFGSDKPAPKKRAVRRRR